jgi:hypothetical protein
MEIATAETTLSAQWGSQTFFGYLGVACALVFASKAP